MKQIDKYKMLASLVDAINYSEFDKKFKSSLDEFLSQVSASACYDRPLRAAVLKMQRAYDRQQREYKRLLKEDELARAAEQVFDNQVNNPRYTY